jgi:hypothetical protein
MAGSKNNKTNLYIDITDDDEETDLDTFNDDNSPRKLPRRHTFLASKRSSRDQSPSSVYSLKSNNIDNGFKHHLSHKLLHLNPKLEQPEIDYTLRMTRVLGKEETNGGAIMVDNFFRSRSKNYIDGKYSNKLECSTPFKPNYLVELKQRPFTSLSRDNQKSSTRSNLKLAANRAESRGAKSAVSTDSFDMRHFSTKRLLSSAPVARPVKKIENNEEEEITQNTISRKQKRIVTKSMEVDKWLELHKNRPRSAMSKPMFGPKSDSEQAKKLERMKLKDELKSEPMEARSVRELAQLTVYDKVQARVKKQLKEKLKMLQRIETENGFNNTVGRMKYFLEDLEEFKNHENSIKDYFVNYSNSNYQKDVVENAKNSNVKLNDDKEEDYRPVVVRSKKSKRKRAKELREEQERKKHTVPIEILKLSTITLYELSIASKFCKFNIK